MTQPRHPDRRSGNSLILASVILTVAALILVSTLPGKDSGDINKKIIANEQRLEKVEEAMRGFMATNGRRPCPADGQYAVGTANFGTEAANPGTCTGGTPSAPMGPDAATGYIVGGVIPTKTLGLSDDFAFDEWGRRFTYLVDTRATLGSSCTSLADGGLTIESSATGGTVLDHTMYAFISHGPDGHGAFPAQGSTVAGRVNTGSTDLDKDVNAGVSGDGTFTYNITNFTASRVQKSQTSAFKDMVWYRPDLKNKCCIGPQCSAASCTLTANQGGGTLASGNTKTEYQSNFEAPCVAETMTCTGSALSCSVGNMTTDCKYATCAPAGFRMDGSAAYPNAGWSIATGDINGDGIPDMVIGASFGAATNGDVFVVYGTASGFADPLPLANLNGTNGFILTYATAGDRAGNNVQVGDFNGDGKADILIAADDAGYNSLAVSGSVYVVYGGATGKWFDGTALAASQALTAGAKPIDGTNGFRIDGAAANEQITWNNGLAIGDINGDGKNDLIIGASQASYNGAKSGSVYVIYGNGAGKMKDGTAFAQTQKLALGTKPLDGTNGFRIDGGSAGEAFGYFIAIGDINGDSKNDLAISAYTAGYNALASSGSVYAIYGNGGDLLPSTTVTTTSAKTCAVVASATELQAGQTIVSANIPAGTTITAVGVNCGSGPSACSGATCVTLSAAATASAAGTAMKLSSSTVTSGSGLIDGTHGFRLDGANASDFLGNLLGVGDFNGDGKADLILGAPGADYNGLSSSGSIYVIFGGATGKWIDGTALAANQKVDAAKPIDGTNGFRIDGESAGDDLGLGGILIGDVDGDGKNDLILGLRWSNYINTKSGSVYAILGNGAGKMKDGTSFGTTKQLVTGSKPIDGTNGFRLDGRQANDVAGRTVALADVNGDGKKDLIMSGYYEVLGGSNPNYGSVYVLFGAAIPPASNPYSLGNLCVGPGC
jgi:hypothetical protein